MPRTEKDSFGEKQVPDDAYYGVHTLRSVENFQISGKPMPMELTISIAKIKNACSRANLELGLLEAEKAKAIGAAAYEIISGKFDLQFPIDRFQAGSGTSTNMNVNEVIANRACEILGKEKGSRHVHPNDDVNRGQSTNDVIPTAIRVSCAELSIEIQQELEGLIAALEEKGKEFSQMLKAGGTHLQDAVPITLGQEFYAYAHALRKHLKRIKEANEYVKVLPIGGNAVGTGINTTEDFAPAIVKHLNAGTGIEFKASENKIEGVQFLTDIAGYSSALRLLAVDLNKIASDLRLLNSGPHTGFAEIKLPPVEPGSSIMPGKINPSIAEAVNMACIQVMANDKAIEFGCASGQLDLNTNMPLIGWNAIESGIIMRGALFTFREKCVKGIQANRERCEWYVHNSAALATALNPVLGYDRVAALVKESLAQNRPIKELILEKGLMTRQELDERLNPERLTRPEKRK